MKLQYTLVLAASCLLAADGLRGGAAPNDSPLQGTWTIVSLEVNGETINVSGMKEARLTVAGERYSFRMGETRLEMTYKVDPAKKPSTLDMTITEGPMKGQTYHAIYRLANGELTICRHVEPDKDRPTEFASAPRSGLMVIVWKRQTP